MYTQLRFIIVKGYKVKSATGKGAWNKVQRNPGTSFQEFSPSGVTQDMFNSSNEL